MSESPAARPGDSGTPDPIVEMAKSLPPLSAEQLLTLFSLLIEARRGVVDHPNAVTGTNVQNPATLQSASSDIADHQAGTSHVLASAPRRQRPLLFHVAAITRLLTAARALAADRDVWKGTLANTISLLLGLIAGLIVIPWTFDRNRAAARADLSIQYAFLSSYGSPIADSAKELITEISQHPLYQTYARARAMSGQPSSLAMFNSHQGSLSPPILRKVLYETAAFADELTRSKEQLKTQKSSLESLSKNDLRLLAFRLLDGPLPSESTALRQSLSRAIDEKLSQNGTLATAVSNLQALMVSVDPEIQVRLTLLNTGARDGLVRHTGSVVYRGTKYSITRTAPPSADQFSVAAVPVFQTNKVDLDFAPQSVGKVAQDSMSDFWYRFSLGKRTDMNLTQLCLPGEHIEVTLYDHNNTEIPGKLECHQE